VKNTATVVRLFNPGAGRPGRDREPKPLDGEWFQKVTSPIKQMLTSRLVERIVVVNNRDSQSAFGESADKNGDTPTGRAIHQKFVDDGDRVEVIYVDEWGQNAGSGRAVQAGIDYLTENSKAETFMVWSPELAITPELLACGLGYMTTFNHDVIGFVRENWQNRRQWMLPQHTGFIGTREHWALGRIPTKADGDEGRTVQTEIGEITLAGMEDL
jgi:hypothetical protein